MVAAACNDFLKIRWKLKQLNKPSGITIVHKGVGNGVDKTLNFKITGLLWLLIIAGMQQNKTKHLANLNYETIHLCTTDSH